MAEQVGYCAYCGCEIVEGSSVLYDDYRDQHFCDEQCYEEWFNENLEKLRSEYQALNIHKVDV